MLELKDEENEDAELNQFVESTAAYKVKNINEKVKPTSRTPTHPPKGTLLVSCLLPGL